MDPPHWGGGIQRCTVISRPRLSGGQTVWRVRVDPPIPTFAGGDYHDEDGLLGVLVGNIRWHHAGKAGVSPGPFHGIDYAAVLDRLPGWEW